MLAELEGGFAQEAVAQRFFRHRRVAPRRRRAHDVEHELRLSSVELDKGRSHAQCAAQLGKERPQAAAGVVSWNVPVAAQVPEYESLRYARGVGVAAQEADDHLLHIHTFGALVADRIWREQRIDLQRQKRVASRQPRRHQHAHARRQRLPSSDVHQHEHWRSEVHAPVVTVHVPSEAGGPAPVPSGVRARGEDRASPLKASERGGREHDRHRRPSAGHDHVHPAA